MRKKYREVYKEEIARLRANRDFQLKEKKRIEKERRHLKKMRISSKRNAAMIERLFHYDRYKRRKRK